MPEPISITFAIVKGAFLLKKVLIAGKLAAAKGGIAGAFKGAGVAAKAAAGAAKVETTKHTLLGLASTFENTAGDWARDAAKDAVNGTVEYFKNR